LRSSSGPRYGVLTGATVVGGAVALLVLLPALAAALRRVPPADQGAGHLRPASPEALPAPGVRIVSPDATTVPAIAAGWR
jgi:hypothetical protein